MNKLKKVWITVAVCLIVIGSIISVLALTSLNFDFSSLSTEKFIESEQQIVQDFNNIKIDVNTSDIKFVPSNDEKCRVISVDTKNVKHTATVQGDTLLISIQDNRKWYEHIGISLGNTSLTVVLPEDSYAALNITADTSDIIISQDFTFDSIDIEGSTGDVNSKAKAVNYLNVKLTTGNVEIGDIDIRNTPYINPKNVNISATTGDVKLWRTGAQENLTVKCTTGDVWFYVVKAPHVAVKTSTGDVEGNLYTAPRFITKTGTGDVKVPDAKNDDVFEITTDTGDIYFKVVK